MTARTAAAPAYKPSYKSSSTARLPQWAMRDGVVFSKTNGVEFGLEYRPPSGIDVTEQVKIGLAESMRQVLTTALPERYRARVMVECIRMAEDQVMVPVRGAAPVNGLLGELAQQEHEQLREMRLNGQLRSVRYFMLIRMPTPPLKSLLSFFKKKGPTSYTVSSIQPHLTRARLTRQHIMGVLQAAGFDTVAMGDQEAFELMWRYYNPGLATAMAPTYVGEVTPPDMSYEELKKRPDLLTGTLAEQLTESDFETGGYNSMIMGNREVFCVNVQGAGTYTFAGMTEPLLDALAQYSYYYVLDCVHEDQIERRKKMNNDAIVALNAATDTSSALGGVPDVGNAAVYEQLRETLFTITADQEHVFRFGVAVVVMATSAIEREEATEVCRSKLSQMGGPRVLVGNVQNIPQIIDNLSPFSGNDNAFLFDALSRNVAHMLPLVSPYVGSTRPIMVLGSRVGTQVGINPQDGTDNYGTLVIGKAGSGKTMLTQKLLLSCRAFGADMIIVDQKDDYRTLVETMDGQFINFTPGQTLEVSTPTGVQTVPVRYNAFEFPSDGNMEEHSRFVLGFLAVLLEEKNGISGEAQTLLTYALAQMYRVAEAKAPAGGIIEQPTLTTFLETLGRMNRVGGNEMSAELKAVAASLKINLSRYTGGTAMGKFLDGQSTVNLNNGVVYFNIFSIKDDPKLRPIALMLITRLIWKRAVRDTNIKVMLVEELGVLLQIPEAAAFVNALFKLGRTYNLWPIAVSQEVRDFESAGGLINNMSQVFIASLTPSESAKLVEVLDLDPGVQGMIDSLSGVNGVSKEYMMIRITSTGRSGGVMVYQPTRGEYWTFTSNPDDRAVRNRAIAMNGGSWPAAIRALARG